MKLWIVLLVACASPAIRAAPGIDDDLLAHRLFVEERYAEAAEIFTDPAWKGVALYRSEQWWRAADAFVRADDAQSAHNLGNAYVKLGYHALALEAYIRAYETDPALDDARFNADLMRRLLALDADEDDAESGGASAADDALEQLESETHDDAEPGLGQDGGEQSTSNAEASGSSESGDGNRAGDDDADPGDNAQGDEDADNELSGEGGGSVNGTMGDSAAASRASGSAESTIATAASEAAGMRTDVATEQATEQWLNRIAHDPARYLERRIALDLRRRQAAGQRAPEGGSVW